MTSLRSLAIALFSCSLFACGSDAAQTPPPLVPEAETATGTGTRPVNAIRPRESKTIGGDPYATPSTTTPSHNSQSSQTPARSGAWSPTPVNGNMNPSPPGPATPVYGEMNPSPPGR